MVAVYSDDTFLTSYPRSGNTWVRFLLSNLLHDEPTTFDNFQARVPDIYKASDAELAATPRPRYLKSHEPMTLDYPRVIYLVRDPRKVARSFLRYLKLTGRYEVDASLTSFVSDFSVGKVPFGSWEEHVTRWIDGRSGDPDFLVVQYEDLEKDTKSELGRMADFATINATDEQLERSVSLSSRARMRALEDAHRQQGGPWLRDARPEIRFIGPGHVPSNETVMQPIEEKWTSTLHRFGYV